jgi:hypothetical protein
MKPRGEFTPQNGLDPPVHFHKLYNPIAGFIIIVYINDFLIRHYIVLNIECQESR